jgi:hypothetical protein
LSSLILEILCFYFLKKNQFFHKKFNQKMSSKIIKKSQKFRKYSKNFNFTKFSTANHVRLAHQLRAPDNTTQFLMDDFEQRETERPCPIAPRLRCYSVCSGVFGTPPVVDVDASSDSELSCDEGEDNEFVQELDTVKLESIEGMSREQVCSLRI